MNDKVKKDNDLLTTSNIEELTCFTDLHIHLDGSLSVNSVKKLAELQGIELEISDEEISHQLMVSEGCKDLNEYLTKFTFPNLFLQTAEGLTEATYTLCEELREQGLMYAEIRFAPQKHCEKGLTQKEVVKAAVAGVKRSTLPAKLILCCMRGNDIEAENIETVNTAAECLGDVVVAVDLAGAEALFPTSDFEQLFRLAKERGVPYTIHAGEADGPESVVNALNYGAKRIGHGVRSVENADLMRRIASEGITLECCPTSNLNTCVFSDYSDFPYNTFFDNNIRFTLNTDNISVSNTNIKKEFIHIHETFGIRRNEMVRMLTNAVDASFATDKEKELLYSKIKEQLL